MPNKIEFLDFEIRIGRMQRKRYPVSVLHSPVGEASGSFALPFSSRQLGDLKSTVQSALLLSRVRTRSVLAPELQKIRNYGGELFNALFTDRIRSVYDSSLHLALSQGKGLRLKLRVEPAELAWLPWEFLYDQQSRQFVALSTKTPIVRYVEWPYGSQTLPVELPIRILVMIASPRDYPELDVNRERQRLERSLSFLDQQGLVEIDVMSRPTLVALQNRLRQNTYHIFHFIGHGVYDEERERGVLILEDERGQGQQVSGELLANLLGDHISLRLAVLNACDGATISPCETGYCEPFSGVGQALVQGRPGIPAVVAMQFAITDDAAIIFTGEFYEALIAAGYPVDAAVSEARKAIRVGLRNTVEWATPVLYMRDSDGRLFEVPSDALSGAQVQRIERLYGLAQESLAAGRLKQAENELQRLLAMQPDHSQAARTLEETQRRLATNRSRAKLRRSIGDSVLTLLAMPGNARRLIGAPMQDHGRAKLKYAGLATTFLASVLIALFLIPLGVRDVFGLSLLIPTGTPGLTLMSTPVRTFVVTETIVPTATETQSPTPTLTSTPTQPSSIEGVVLPQALNVRKNPSVQSVKVATLHAKDRVRVVARTPDNIWFRIVTDEGNTGFVVASYIEIKAEGRLDQLEIDPVEVETIWPSTQQAASQSSALPKPEDTNQSAMPTTLGPTVSPTPVPNASPEQPQEQNKPSEPGSKPEATPVPVASPVPSSSPPPPETPVPEVSPTKAVYVRPPTPYPGQY